MSATPEQGNGSRRETRAQPGGQLPPKCAVEPIARRLITHTDILDLIVRNASLPDILQVITAMVEREITGARASILLLDSDGLHLHVGAGPSLPAEYNAAIEGITIGPDVGTCGKAAYSKQIVVTPSIADEPAWDVGRADAQAAGLAACWSTPFLGLHERVLGTFAVYFDAPREPAAGQLELLHDAGYLAAVAVQHDNVRQLLRQTGRTHPVTGIANRVALIEHLHAVESASARTGDKFAIVQAAIAGVAPINEALGLSVGDDVLRTVAQRLTAIVNARGIAAHLWGSDFAVLQGGLRTDEDALAIAERVRATLAEPLSVQGMSVEVGVTLGVAVYDGEILSRARPEDEPLRAANVAVERAKASGNQIGMYDPRSDPGTNVRLLGPALRNGIAREELSLAYQPVVSLADAHIDHFEALLRWSTPQGVVPPDSFVPVAEQTGLVHDLGRFAMERALGELARQRALGNEFGMSVNLSGRQLTDDHLPDVVAELIDRYQLLPGSVTLEVTEGVLLDSSASAWTVLSRLHKAGARISLDDFGTGYSQINYLRRYPFDELKIDRMFVRDMHTDVAARAIIVGAIAFARAAGITTVCEGIEHAEQAEQLRELGCVFGQGYLYGGAATEPAA